jgi:hypothetical protein
MWFILQPSMLRTDVQESPCAGQPQFGEERPVGYHHDSKLTVGVSGHPQRFFIFVV